MAETRPSGTEDSFAQLRSIILGPEQRRLRAIQDRDDVGERRTIERDASRIGFRDQIVDGRPTLGVERDADPLRRMTQDETEELARLLVHEAADHSGHHSNSFRFHFAKMPSA